VPHRCSVLIVDDDSDLRELLGVLLDGEGYIVAVARDGREAIDVLRSTPEICIIVLDLAMPLMDGIAFRTAQLRDRSLAWIPVMVMSGVFDAARVARELGACAFIRKPVDLDSFRRALHAIRCRRTPTG
jgi:two-component system, chemotaxis family, chemotaxis protein CheY